MTRQQIKHILAAVLWVVAGSVNAQECLDETAVVAPGRNVETTAQFGLLGLLGQDDETAREIATALEAGKLAGIYKADQGVAALRARDHYFVGWWEVIEEGNARCLTEGGRPILVYRKSLDGQNAAVGDALKVAWPQCGISVTPRCYQARQIGKLSAAQCEQMIARIRSLDPTWPERINRTIDSLMEECQTEGSGPGWVGTMRCVEQNESIEAVKDCYDQLP